MFLLKEYLQLSLNLCHYDDMDNVPNPTVPNPSTPNQPSDWVEPGHPVQNPEPIATPPPPSSLPPSQPLPIPNSVPVVGFPQKKGISGFSIFVVVSILLLLGVWGVVGYLYYQNKTLAQKKEETPIAQVATPSPTPELNPAEIQIANGSISWIMSSGETKTLVKKEDYPTTGITGFAKVAVSPDKKKLCFEALAPATEPALYVSDIDGTNVSIVEKNRNTCTWLSDSNHILYLNAPIGTKAMDVYTYDLSAKVETNQTKDTQTATRFRQYAVSQSADTLECQYSIVNSTGSKLTSGICNIDSQTGVVTDSVAE